MDELGKADREFFDQYLYPNLGAEREDVQLAPQHRVDFGVVDAALEALEAEGIPAAVVGEVTDGEGVIVDGKSIDHPGTDPFWGTFERLAEEASSGDGSEEGGENGGDDP